MTGKLDITYIKRNNQHNLNAPSIDGEQINKTGGRLKWQKLV